jgi:hypothetical protein
VERLEYGTIEIWSDHTSKRDRYHRAIRYRANNLPEACPHRHGSKAEAEVCREFHEVE